MGSWEDEVAKGRAEDAVAAHTHFEAVKSHFRQSKEGVTISFILNPADAPRDLITAPIGQRYMCVLVPIGDDEQPVVSPEKRQIEDEIRSCGILCRDIEFQCWMNNQGMLSHISDAACADAIREFCGIASRTEFRTNPKALQAWRAIHNAYLNGERYEH